MPGFYPPGRRGGWQWLRSVFGEGGSVRGGEVCPPQQVPAVSLAERAVREVRPGQRLEQVPHHADRPATPYTVEDGAGGERVGDGQPQCRRRPRPLPSPPRASRCVHAAILGPPNAQLSSGG